MTRCLMIVAAWGVLLAVAPAKAQGADDCFGRPRHDQEIEVVGRGLARALLQPGVSLVVFRPDRPVVDDEGPPPSALWKDLNATSDFGQHCTPVEISEVLTGPAETGGAILARHAARATHLSLLESCYSRDYDRVLATLDEGSIGPMFRPQPPFPEHVAVVVPLLEERIPGEVAREEYRRLVAAHAGDARAFLEPLRSWIDFSLDGAEAGRPEPDAPRDPFSDGTRLARDVIVDLRTIVDSVLPPVPAKFPGAASLRTCPLETFRVARGKLTTEVGRVVLDELERLASVRVVPTEAKVRFLNERTKAFEEATPEPPAKGLAMMWDGDLRTRWKPSTVGGSYEIEMRLDRRERLTRIDIEWSMADGKRSLGLFLSGDKGRTWRQAEISGQRSIDTSGEVASSDETTAVLLDGAPVDRVRIRFDHEIPPMAEGVGQAVEVRTDRAPEGDPKERDDADGEPTFVSSSFAEIDLRTRPIPRSVPRERR